MKFRKKPIVIEAVQWTGDNPEEIHKFMGVCQAKGTQLMISTLEGLMYADKGDWVIKGIAGEIYPCKPDIFEQTYEEVLGK